MTAGNETELDRLRKMEQAQKKRYKKQNEYLSTIYDRLNITIPAGKKSKVQDAANASGLSVNAFCAGAILQKVADMDTLDTGLKMRDQGITDDVPDCFKDI